MIKNLLEIWKRRELLYNLVIKDLKIKYKGSILGFAWSVFTPVITMLVMVVIFSKFMRFEYPNYPVFVLSGIIVWNLLSASLSGSAVVLSGNANLITKIYFPREIFPLSVVFSKVVDFFIALVILFIFIIFYKIQISIFILLLPVIFIVHLLFIIGISMLISCLNLFYRDVKHMLDFILFVWFYATPVFYPISLIPEKYLKFYLLNPMVSILAVYRDILIDGKMPDIRFLVISFILSMAVFWISYVIFKHYENRFAEEV